jgi:triphosphoribosyl-dephospho-CoA synthase
MDSENNLYYADSETDTCAGMDLGTCPGMALQECAPAAAAHAPGARLAQKLADVAVQALIGEAELTPKPALVDRRGGGAHRDLDLQLMRRSARSLHPGFVAMAQTAYQRAPEQSLREELARIGRDTEQAMLAVTNGSNAHRGAIWVLGLLIAAAASTSSRKAEILAATAGRIALHTDRFAPQPQQQRQPQQRQPQQQPSSPLSNGERMRRRYGVRGARGEAQDGFPHVVAIALPALRQTRARGGNETHARLDALLAIMVSLEDTCLLHRGGGAALLIAQSGAREVLVAGGSATPDGLKRLLALDAALLARNASPGGAADLLSAALFLDRLEQDENLSNTESGILSYPPDASPAYLE